MGQKLDNVVYNIKPMFSDCVDVVYFSSHAMCISIKAGGMLVPYWSQTVRKEIEISFWLLESCACSTH